MKVLENKNDIINSMKILLLKEDEEILAKLDFDDDEIFLDPLLIAFFSGKKKNNYSTEILKEILQGHMNLEKDISINFSYNDDGNAYLPKLGYFKKDSNNVPYDDILKWKGFEIIKEIHPLLKGYFVEFYKGKISNPNPSFNSAWENNYLELFEAIDIIEEHVPELYEELTFANNKIYLHDNPKILNFASLETLGILYLYVIGIDNIIYFIEELMHQGAHNYLCYILHNSSEYFKQDVENLMMKEVTQEEWDYRSVYDAFHGLFTVNRRLKCFDTLLTKKVFSGRYRHEILGRLTDQFSRYETGLEKLNLDEVYTEKGIKLYKELDIETRNILIKYKTVDFDLSNRDLDFRYSDFCELNPLEDFLKKESENYYAFSS